MTIGSGFFRVIFVGGVSREPVDCASLNTARYKAAEHARPLLRPGEIMGWQDEDGRLRVGRTQAVAPWWVETLAVIEELPE